MKFEKPPQPPAATDKPENNPAQAAASNPDLGLTERRKVIRPLPAPQAVESHADTDWALFHSLSDGQGDSPPQ